MEKALKAAFAPGHRRESSASEEGEDLAVYVRDLERLLDKAYPGIRDPLRSQQLVDQFLFEMRSRLVACY